LNRKLTERFLKSQLQIFARLCCLEIIRLSAVFQSWPLLRLELDLLFFAQSPQQFLLLLTECSLRAATLARFMANLVANLYQI